MTAAGEFTNIVRNLNGFRVLCALLLVASAAALQAAPASAADPSEYGFVSTGATVSTTQAGAHPDVQLAFELKTDPTSFPDPKGLHEPVARTQNLSIELPPGLIGNPNAVSQCSPVQFESYVTLTGEGCPFGSQVGVVVLRLYPLFTTLTEPIYNMTPPGEDVVAKLGFYAGTVPNFISVHVRSQSDYGLTADIQGIPSSEGLVSAVTTLWGVPGDSSHNTLRLTPNEAFPSGKSQSPPRSSGHEPEPFMSNPTSCGTPLSVTTKANSYQLPDLEAESVAPLGSVTGCGKVAFTPNLTLAPTTRAAASPSGLDATLTIPQNESINGLATSQLRSATVKVPAGLSILTNAADGLQACSSSQVRFQEDVTSECPEASKIGTAEFDVPALSRVLKGSIYQRSPEPGHLFRIWLVADELGVHVKIAGEIQANPVTGQITSVFVDTPQVPLESLALHFKGGPRGVLITPASCGIYQAEWEFGPWSGGPPAIGSSPFTIDEGCGTGGFSPELSAGSTNAAAGSSTHFVLDLNRKDGEQNVSAVDVNLPNGLLAKPKGVPLCEGAAAVSAQCPAGSQVGTVSVASGAGSNPLWIPQPGKPGTAVYLSGPYHGAPYSLVIKVPAQAGPFDLGTVVTRAAIEVNPTTTAVSVKSDPLPQILEGVPIFYRAIHVDVDREDFMINPTSCEPSSVGATVTSIAGKKAQLSSPFQVGSCASLNFAPKLALSLKGPTKRTGHATLKAVVTYPSNGSYANIARAQVNLPHSVFLDQGNLNKTCTKPVLLAGDCPKSTIYGKARAWTPLLDESLAGPVYLVGGYGFKLPALVAELNGQIKVLLVGKIDTGKNGGIRTIFEGVPDAPVSRFVLEMKGGKKYGLLENSENICGKPQKAITRFTGQNGKVENLEATIANGCDKKKDAAHKKTKA